MQEYILPVLFFLAAGAVIGVLLTVASKVFAVKTDETVSRISEALPGANCGGCGYSGCDGYAAAVASGETPPDLCRPGGLKTAEIIGGIVGVQAGNIEPLKAFVRCNGNCDATRDKFTYIGTRSCVAIERFYNGKGECRSGCHGMGDCIRVCDKGCISVKNGVAVVDPTDCIGCGKCVKVCPNRLIVLVPESKRFMVRCSSDASGKETRAVCQNGCIACGLCVKKCPENAIVINNNHAETDMKKCTGCGICAQVCPVGCIEDIRSLYFTECDNNKNVTRKEGER